MVGPMAGFLDPLCHPEGNLVGRDEEYSDAHDPGQDGLPFRELSAKKRRSESQKNINQLAEAVGRGAGGHVPGSAGES